MKYFILEIEYDNDECKRFGKLYESKFGRMKGEMVGMLDYIRMGDEEEILYDKVILDDEEISLVGKGGRLDNR